MWAKKKLVWLTSKESVINWLSKSNILTQTKRKLVLISKKTFYFVHKLVLKRLTKNVYHYKYSKNGRFGAIFISTLIFKATHEFNLKINLDEKNKKKTVLAHFGDNLDFKGNLNYSPVNNLHTLFRMSHFWVLKRMWMISTWTILLSYQGDNCSREDFQISMLYPFAKKSWRAFICSSAEIVSLLMRSYLKKTPWPFRISWSNGILHLFW